MPVTSMVLILASIACGVTGQVTLKAAMTQVGVIGGDVLADPSRSCCEYSPIRSLSPASALRSRRGLLAGGPIACAIEPGVPVARRELRRDGVACIIHVR